MYQFPKDGEKVDGAEEANKEDTKEKEDRASGLGFGGRLQAFRYRGALTLGLPLTVESVHLKLSVCWSSPSSTSYFPTSLCPEMTY